MAKGEKGGLYLGVDVGGTKILAGVADASGRILARKRRPTPQKGTPEETLAAIFEVMGEALAKAGVDAGRLNAIGLAVPGQIAPDEGRIIGTPNMNLAGVEIVAPVEERFGVRAVLGNDVRLGTLGEKWMGAAREARSAVGIFVGTGIGGGLIMDGKLVVGSRGVAGEIGHVIVQPGGPRCGCGGRGCLEALASRTAIERDIRAGIAAGRKTVLGELTEDVDGPVKGRILARALERNDPLVSEVMRKACEVLGDVCVSVRHLIDPDVIVLGGGVVEACGRFVMPIVKRIVAADPLPATRRGGEVVQSVLGDDATVLGAVALAQGFGRERPVMPAPPPKYPRIKCTAFGEVAVGGSVYTGDVYIRGDGTVKKRNKKKLKQRYGTSHKIGPEELEKVLRGGPRLLVVGMGHSGMAGLTPEGQEYLRERGVEFELHLSGEAGQAYNRAKGRKAALIHVTC